MSPLPDLGEAPDNLDDLVELLGFDGRRRVEALRALRS
jgi:hypothetical protein